MIRRVPKCGRDQPSPESDPTDFTRPCSLAHRENTHTLFSGSFDRTVKTWSLDDRAYVDTLFGHQGPILSVDVLRNERCVSTGHDHTCRVWKIPEESQLIFRCENCILSAYMQKGVGGRVNVVLGGWHDESSLQA